MSKVFNYFQKEEATFRVSEPMPFVTSTIQNALVELSTKYDGQQICQQTFDALRYDILTIARAAADMDYGNNSRRYKMQMHEDIESTKRIKDLEEKLITQELKHKEEIEYYKMLTEEN